MKKTKRALFSSVVALILCFSMLLGTTFAWFTDSVESGKNQIVAGNLDIELYWSDDATAWHRVDEKTNIFKENAKWEPGHTEVVYLKIVNEGTLALKYQLGINVAGETGSVNVLGEEFKLSQHIRFGVAAGEKQFANRNAAVEAVDATATALNQAYTSDVAKLASKDEQIVTLVVYMPTSVGNEANHAKGAPIPTINLGIRLQATQVAGELDSFDGNYDAGATFPEIEGGDVILQVTTENGLTTAAFSESADGLTLAVPAGVKTTGNTLSLTVDEMATSGANITVFGDQMIRPLDVHVAGVAGDNTQPMTVTIEKALMPGLNLGNYKLFHVEANGTNEMTLVAADATFDAHNQFKYDPATGDMVLYMATFSEVAMVAEPAKWEGKFDYSWYDADATELTIANADQLAAFGAIVGGMNGQTQDSFTGKTVKLVADINLGDKESENNPNIIFYPIGYYNSEGTYERTNTAITSGLRNFKGTFDGNGHTVSNFYHNTWEMKGDHDWYSPQEQYYRDGMGLFGRVYKGTVKNLTVKNFSSDGEIATTGVIAAYADGATFENIAIFDCNPRVYNIGNGGIVGCVGWYAKEANLKTTFKNITVDNSNKISALWGSYDVACGGIVGQYYPTSGQSSVNYPVNAGIYFENCHISAQMDVYNDVCANYQYYAYRYTGMLIGSVRENVTIDGHVYPKMDKITAENCTVHFGTWNDYYYCEIVANSLASYTHDHQFSRLTQVASVDVDNKKIVTLKGETVDVPTSGWAHYVVVNGEHASENATCYHFVDGKVWNHKDAGTETVNGQTVLKEDNQHIYLEFNNLVTGYGWGVTTKGVGDLAGVTILDREVANSVEKFEGKVTELSNNKKYKLGDIFSFVDKGIKLVPGALVVSVHNLGENNPVSATIAYDRENWENGTLTLTGTGKVQITIQDYYFCTPTTIEVTVTEREPAEKFDVVMNNGDFLHRVGNSGTVALDKLFKAKEGVSVGTVSVTVEAVNGTAASGTYSNNAIQFNGTGVVKVTITDNDYCTPTVLYLEVVDAVNATSATSATSNNVVLLNDISGGFTVSNGWAFYGNGFKVTCSGKGYRLNYAGMYGGFIEVKDGGVLDNVQVFCDIYPVALLYSGEAKDYKNEDVSTTEKTYYNYQLSAVAITDNGSMITNSYVYGGRNNIYVGDGNISIVNTTTENGVLANIQIKSSNASTVTLKDVTTIQNEVKSTYDATKTMLGCGILVGDVTSVSNPKLIIQGEWNHYNWVTAANATNTSNTYAQEIINTALSHNNYVHTNASGVKTVSLGMIVLNTLTPTIDDQRAVKDNYLLSNVTMSLKDPDTGMTGNVNGQVYSVQAGKGDPDSTAPDYMPTKNLEYKPTATKSENVAGSYDSKESEEDSCYCYWDGDVLKLSYVENESAFALDVAKLVSFAKFGYDLTIKGVTVTKNGVVLTAVDGKVTFTDAGSYVITYTVTDPYNYNKDGSQVAEASEWTFAFDVEVSVVKSKGKNAEINVSSTSFYGNYGKTSNFLDPDFHYCIPFMKDVTITDYAEDGVTASGFNVTSNIISITVAGDKTSGTVTLQYLDGRKLVVTVSGHSVGLGSSGNTISVKSYNNQLWICTDGVSNNATTGTWKVMSYAFTGNNGVTVPYTIVRTCNFDSASTTNSPQTGWSSFGGPAVDSVKYTVTYNANGGSCSKTEAYTTSSSTVVTLPTPTRSGYIFAGWYTAASGGTRVGGAGDSYTPSSNITLYAQWGQPCTVTYNANGGSCGTASEKYTGTALTLPTPTRSDYIFAGWYTAASGGTRVGGAGESYAPSADITLYAQWTDAKQEITVTFDATTNGGTCTSTSKTVVVGNNVTLPTPNDRTGYRFLGWYTAANGGTKIGDAGASYTPSANITLYAQWQINSYVITVTTNNATVEVNGTVVSNNGTVSIQYGAQVTVKVTYKESKSQSTTIKGTDGTTYTSPFNMPAQDVTINAYSEAECIVEGTLITMADGTQKAVEDLVVGDMVLAFNHVTGQFEATPIIFNTHSDQTEASEHNVLYLEFANGEEVKIVGAHGFFDMTLMQYVYVDYENYSDYIGHEFYYAGNDGTSADKVVLENAYIQTETVRVFCPVTYFHMNSISNGFLNTPNIPGGITGLVNYFEYDPDLKYNEEAMQRDIEKYGLYTYDDFSEYISEEAYNSSPSVYLKVAVGKGMITYEQIIDIILWLLEGSLIDN